MTDLACIRGSSLRGASAVRRVSQLRILLGSTPSRKASECVKTVSGKFTRTGGGCINDHWILVPASELIAESGFNLRTDNTPVVGDPSHGVSESPILQTQEVRGSSPCAPTTLSTNRATHVLPREARNPGFLEGCKCQQNGDFEAFRGRDDARCVGLCNLVAN